MLVQSLVTIYGGYLLDCKAKQLFPFVKNKVEKLDGASKRKIFSNAFSMMNIRISQTLINATDNLLISAMISTVLVGIYSNYSMITQIILTTAFLIESSMAASIGNLCCLLYTSRCVYETDVSQCQCVWQCRNRRMF